MAQRNRRGRQRRRLAAADATVRFAPEYSAINALARQIKADYKTDVGIARGGSRAAVASARASRKPLRQIYNRAQATADTAHEDIEAAFGRIGAGAAPWQAVTEREYGLQKQRTADAGARALAETVSQANEARLGRIGGVQQAGQRKRTALQEIGIKLADLGDRQGAYIAGVLGDLRESDRRNRGQLAIAEQYGRNNAVTQRGQERVANIYAGSDAASNASQERIAAGYAGGGGGGGAGGGGRKPASRSELRGFNADFAKALRYARDYSRGNDPRRVAANDLTTGVRAKGDDPGVPAIDDQLAISVALDMAYQGHLSKRNYRRLRQAGITVRDLPGVVSLKQWRRQHPLDRPALAPGSRGQSRPT